MRVRHPRRRSERMTNRSFLRTMFLTGCLTAGVAFAVPPRAEFASLLSGELSIAIGIFLHRWHDGMILAEK